MPSTPHDPSVGFLDGDDADPARRPSVAPGDVRYVVHGTTVATNAIIEGKVAPTGFVTTDGFRDMLEIARQIRPSLYDLQFEKPPPLVPRHRCFGVPERLDARGEVIVAARRGGACGRRPSGCGPRASSRSPSASSTPTSTRRHERRAGEIVREVFPEAIVSLSSEVAPEIREYLRASTTVINACVRPIVARYLQRHRGAAARGGADGRAAA